MSLLDIVAYTADALILGTYALMARTNRTRPFHIANAVGGIPLLAVEVLAHAWPVMPLTAAFTIIGGYGVMRDVATNRR